MKLIVRSRYSTMIVKHCLQLLQLKQDTGISNADNVNPSQLTYLKRRLDDLEQAHRESKAAVSRQILNG